MRRWILAAVAIVAVAAVLVAVGRWERDRRAEEEVDGMGSVLTAVGDLASPSLSAFRVLGGFQCLLYERRENPVALEVCFDTAGRLVEAIDRRGDEPKIWSVRDDPTRSTIRVDRLLVDKLLIGMGVPPRLIDEAHARSE